MRVIWDGPLKATLIRWRTWADVYRYAVGSSWRFVDNGAKLAYLLDRKLDRAYRKEQRKTPWKPLSSLPTARLITDGTKKES